MNPVPPKRAYAQWLQSRLATLRDLHEHGRPEDIRSLADDLAQSARSMGHREIEAAAQAIHQGAANSSTREAAIEILRRIIKRGERSIRRAA